jgi:3-hydroxy-9,10-secoandrosta-1,3,5(10)-triene-9,17-dione monooxygenase reductase component
MSNSVPGKPSATFRQALGAFATGVTIVTTRDPDGTDVGLTANSFNSVSLDPPMVLWSLARRARSLSLFERAGHFAIHVLASDQRDISDRFSRPAADRFAGLAIERGIAGLPLLKGCAARFQCRTAYRYDGGDHVIFVGEVVEFDHSERAPLVFHGGAYAVAARHVPHDPTLAAGGAGIFGHDFLIYLLARSHHQQFLLLRSQLAKHGMSEADWFVLGTLGATVPMSLAELDKQLAYTGAEVTYEQLAGLAAAGFLQLEGAHDPSVQVTLTAQGTQAVIELLALAKAAEVEVERHIGTDDARLLKLCLQRIVERTPSAPRGRRSGPDE